MFTTQTAFFIPLILMVIVAVYNEGFRKDIKDNEQQFIMAVYFFLTFLFFVLLALSHATS